MIPPAREPKPPHSTLEAPSAPLASPISTPRESSGSTGAEATRLNAETVKLLAEANESRARQLSNLEQIGAWLQRDLAKEAARLQELDADLRRREARAPNQLGPGPTELNRQADAQPVETQQVLAETNARKAETESIHSLLWPSPMRAEAWRLWRDRLVRRAAAEAPAGILLARIHTTAAFERAGRPFSLELLRDLGRAIYDAGGEEVEKLAQAFTQTAAGRFEIRTIRVGDRIDHKFMKPSAGGLAEVQTVSSWAVRDANGIWQFPAEVA